MRQPYSAGKRQRHAAEEKRQGARGCWWEALADLDVDTTGAFTADVVACMGMLHLACYCMGGGLRESTVLATDANFGVFVKLQPGGTQNFGGRKYNINWFWLHANIPDANN